MRKSQPVLALAKRVPLGLSRLIEQLLDEGDVFFPRTFAWLAGNVRVTISRTSPFALSARPPPPYAPFPCCQTQEFFERLAAMTPRPETHLLMCHSLLASRARCRARVVAYGRAEPDPTASA